MSYSYSSTGRLLSVTDSVNGTIDYEYDVRGLRSRMIPQLTGVSPINYNYDDAGRLKVVRKEDETTGAVYSYDDAGKRTELTLENGVSTSYSYSATNDQLDVLDTTSPSAGNIFGQTFTRNEVGMPEHVVYAESDAGPTNSVDYGYDGAWRLNSEVRKDSAGELLYSQEFTYDAIGNRIRMISKKLHAYKPDASTVGLWHLDGDTDDDSGSDNDGDVLSDGSFVTGHNDDALVLGPTSAPVTVPHNDSLNLGSDDFTIEAWIKPSAHNGAIISKGVPGTNGFDGWKFYVDPADSLPRFEFGTNVVTGTQAIVLDTWTHLAIERSGSNFTLYVDGTAAGTATITDPVTDNTAASLVIGAVNTGTIAAPVYTIFEGMIDEIRLSKVARGAELLTVDLAYDYNTGNQSTREYVTGHPAGTGWEKLYSYDANGNQITADEKYNGITTRSEVMTYDLFNRMTSWTDGTKTNSYGYRGAEWHRSSTTVDGATSGFLYDGENVIADLSSDNVLKSYVTPMLDQNLSVTDHPTGQPYYYNQDDRQSVHNLTDNTGAVAAVYDYTAMGESVTALTNPFGLWTFDLWTFDLRRDWKSLPVHWTRAQSVLRQLLLPLSGLRAGSWDVQRSGSAGICRWHKPVRRVFQHETRDRPYGNSRL